MTKLIGRVVAKGLRMAFAGRDLSQRLAKRIAAIAVFSPMIDEEPGLRTRLIFGALAGFVATAAMTSAMWRLHGKLPQAERYPLPPKEITQEVVGGRPDGLVRDQAMMAHFAYGAATGALVTAVNPGLGPLSGALAGVGIWTGSYFGWVPGLGILAPANRHPARRNALMIAVHLVWGAATAITFRDLLRARGTILNDRAPLDAESS